ncbi:hypothetical protein Pst134EB_010565 [Puccinia striiformis f. sp. tritici]|nr:hypothetical protein Pst134EB_010565 [Puccinia striiformis f. sp. tritici]
MGEVEKVRVQKTDAPAAADLPVCSKSALDTILLTEIDQASQSKTDRWTQLLAETWNSISEPQATRYLHRSIDPTSYQPTQANSGYQRLICKSLSGRTCAELTPSSLPTCFECILLDQKDLGFSGSGKSTSLRLITNQFIKLSQNNSFGPSSQSSQALRLADQISHLFLLLNSFTTAKTFQNPSAFRLSTLLKLHFDNLLHLVGAKLLVFGLERNRLRIPLKSAHNQTFDVFYQLLAGIPSD